MQNVCVQEDIEGIQPWSRIEETFVKHRGRDQLDCRVTYFRDGTIQQDDFVSGALRHRIISNGAEGSLDGSIKPWDQIELRYDDQGSELQVTTFFSDGGVRNEMFHIALWHDETPNDRVALKTNAPLKTVTIDYDAKGKVCGRHFFHVDGAIVYERYEDDVLLEVLQELAPGVVTSDSRSWSSIVQCFDETGTLTRKVTVWDDGAETEEIFEDAQIEMPDESDLQFAMQEAEAIFEEQDVTFEDALNQPMDEIVEVLDEETSAFETAMAEWLQSKFGAAKEFAVPANHDQSMDMAVGA